MTTSMQLELPCVPKHLVNMVCAAPATLTIPWSWHSQTDNVFV